MSKKAKIETKFRIKIFEDYHEIRPTRTSTALELGCFPAKGYSCHMYFGLFYPAAQGVPSAEKIFERLSTKILFTGDYRNPDLVLAEVRAAISYVG